jgi:SAM-dependent methyltransferase
MSSSHGAIGNVTKSPELVEMAMAYSRSRVLCAAARLGIADALGNDERSVEELAVICGADVQALRRLLRALAGLGITAETAPGHFVLAPFGQPLRRDAPDSAWAGVVFWSDLLADSWSCLTECVRDGKTAFQVMESKGIAPLWSTDPDASAIFRAVMGTAPAENYMPIANAWDFGRFRSIADLGGGGGALLDAILFRYPHLHGMLVDRPESIEAAKPRFEANGLRARCKLIAADLKEEVPSGADVYILKHVLHGCKDAAAIDILRNCGRVLSAKGRLLIVEFVLPDVVSQPDAALERRLMSDINMLAVTGGKERSASEWSALLANAGFTAERFVAVPELDVSIIETRKQSD